MALVGEREDLRVLMAAQMDATTRDLGVAPGMQGMVAKTLHTTLADIARLLLLGERMEMPCSNRLLAGLAVEVA